MAAARRWADDQLSSLNQEIANRMSQDEARMKLREETLKLREETLTRQEAELGRIEAFVAQEIADREDDEAIRAVEHAFADDPAAFIAWAQNPVFTTWAPNPYAVGANPQDPVSAEAPFAAAPVEPRPKPHPRQYRWARSPSPRSSDTWGWIQACVAIHDEQERARHADLDRDDDALVELGRRWDDEDAAHTPSWANIDGDSTVDDDALVDEAFNAVEPYAPPPRCLHLSLLKNKHQTKRGAYETIRKTPL